MIGLVACCKQKRAEICAAEKLYTSQLFVKSVSYVRARCSQWAILSAKYGLLLPSDIVRPYQLTLKAMSSNERQAWASKVNAQLKAQFSGSDVTFLVLAGRLYRQCLHDLPHECPMRGLGIGQQLRFLTKLK